jgi:hypothetical protein
MLGILTEEFGHVVREIRTNGDNGIGSQEG